MSGAGADNGALAAARLAAVALTRRFGAEAAVDALDLAVQAGTVQALVGLNGAGKTTLMRMLLGMIGPTSGEALVLGHRAVDAPSEVWQRVGHSIETPFAYGELTVRENLWVAARLHGLGRDRAVSASAGIVGDLDLGRWADRPARALSLGNRQRLGLACALVHGPDVLVLDEPTNSLDPAGVLLVRNLLRRAADERGASVLVSSHHLDEIARIADTITVLHRGRIVGTLDPAGTDLERRFFAVVHAADERMRQEV